MQEAAIATPAQRPAPTLMVKREKQPYKLPQRELRLSEHHYADFSICLPVGIPFEATLKPEFWALSCIALQSNPTTNAQDMSGANIHVRTEDHAFQATLYVRAVQERGLVVDVLHEPVYFGLKEVKSENFRTRWNVGKRGYDIIRLSDNEIVRDGSKLPTKEMAQSWIDKTMKEK